MPRTITAVAALATMLTLLTFGCAERKLAFGGPDGGADLASTQPDLVGADLAGADLTTPDLVSTAPPGKIGDGCTIPIPPQEGLVQGSCDVGLYCIGSNLNAPGGYCTHDCDPWHTPPTLPACGETAFCTESSGGYCLRRCASANDCRAGYTCGVPLGGKDQPQIKVCYIPDPPPG